VSAEKRLPVRIIKEDEDEDEDNPLSSLPFDFKDEIEERFNESKPAPKSGRALIKDIIISSFIQSSHFLAYRGNSR
jgi:hypothetical protein